MPENSIELRRQMGDIWNRMKDLNAQAEAEGRNLTESEQGTWNQYRDEVVSLTSRAQRAEYLDSIPSPDREHQVWDLKRDQQAGPPTTPEEADVREKRAYAEAFRAYLTARDQRMIGPEVWDVLHRRGMQALSAEDMAKLPAQYRAAMSTTSQTGGGFWIPDEMMQPIEKAMLWYGGMAQFATTITTDTGADLPWPVYDDTANSGRRLAENTLMTQTDISVGVRTMKAFTYSSDEVLVSVQLMQDAPEIANQVIADALGERVARAQNADFTNYSGADGPQGLITATTSALTAGAQTAVTADELRRLQWAVGRAYRDHPSAKYMMHDSTLAAIIGLVDGNGNYLFNPDVRQGGEPTIWGKQVVVNNDMPALATGVVGVVYGKGDAYKIRRVRGFTLMRLDERYAPSLQVSFLGFARADGAYINAGQNPIQHITMA